MPVISGLDKMLPPQTQTAAVCALRILFRRGLKSTWAAG